MKLTAELKTLQARLDLADSLTDRRNMPEDVLILQVHRVRNLRFKMHQESNHKMPHIHIRSPDYAASFSINPAKKLAGNIPAKQGKIVVGWIDENRATLLNLWANLQEGKEVSPFVESLRGNA